MYNNQLSLILHRQVRFPKWVFWDEILTLFKGYRCSSCSTNIINHQFYRKGTDKHPTLNKGFFKEYETYIKDIFGKSIEVLGPPLASKDPRDEFANCLEKTLRNKVKKMTYLHIYFKVINQKYSSKILLQNYHLI